MSLYMLQHPFVLGDLDRRLAGELLEKAYNAKTHYVDPSDTEQEDEAVGYNARTHAHT